MPSISVAKETTSQEILSKVSEITGLRQILVHVEAGTAVKCTNGSTVLSGTASSGTVLFTVPRFGVWVLTATHQQRPSSLQLSVAVNELKLYDIYMSYYKINITVPAGSAITAEFKGITISGTANNGTYTLYVPVQGEWQITASLNDKTTKTTVNVSEEKEYSITMAYYDAVLDKNSWATIRQLSDEGKAANIWHVGDKKSIILNGKAGNTTFNNLKIDIFIIGFNHNSAKEGNNRIHFLIGKINDVFVALCDSGYGSSYSSNGYFNMNPNNTNNGGWRDSYMRKILLGNSNIPTAPLTNSLMAALPADLRSVMKSITKYSDNHGGGNDSSSYISSTEDYLFLLAEFEVHGSRNVANSSERNFQLQYDYFKAGNSKIAKKHNDTATAVNWWLRSVYYGDNSTFCYVTPGGGCNNYSAYSPYGVVPGVCV